MNQDSQDYQPQAQSNRVCLRITRVHHSVDYRRGGDSTFLSLLITLAALLLVDPAPTRTDDTKSLRLF